jgi:FMN phosphatase YigB (HAD superfamily)
MEVNTQHYLFDLGDTLMVDLPNQTGPMCDWPEVQVVDGALDCLKRLSLNAECHLATNAAESSEAQIWLALKRAGLCDYIGHVFCRENLGVGKTDINYYPQIVNKLAVSSEQVTMVGDSLERDVLPALKSGLKGIWFNPKKIFTDLNIDSVDQLITVR